MGLPRGLSETEKSFAREVFLETIPYSHVYVSSFLGMDNRPFTLPVTMLSANWGVMIGPVGKWVSDQVAPTARFILCVGDAYDTGLHASADTRRLLIHELTHVWQGEHSNWTWGYVFNSLLQQARSGKSAYSYDPSKLSSSKWSDYNVEQQADIVEDWFAGGKSDKDDRYKFITSVIRSA